MWKQVVSQLRVHVPSIYLSLILFGQVFLSSVANLLSVDNRLVMLALRFSIMIFSYGYIYFFLRDKRMQFILICGLSLSFCSGFST